MFSQELVALRIRLVEVDKLRKHLMDSIAALEKAQAHFKHQDGSMSVSSLGSEGVENNTGGVSQRAAIRESISVMAGEFTSRDVMQFLHDFHPAVHATLKPEVLSNALYKFTREGVIKQVRQGTRGRPSGFVRLESTQSSPAGVVGLQVAAST